MSDLMKIPGVGQKVAQYLTDIGYSDIASLKGQNPEEIYLKDCSCRGYRDRCALYVYRLAVAYADTNGELPPGKKNWWNWKD